MSMQYDLSACQDGEADCADMISLHVKTAKQTPTWQALDQHLHNR